MRTVIAVAIVAFTGAGLLFALAWSRAMRFCARNERWHDDD